jgi:hypothetical protein
MSSREREDPNDDESSDQTGDEFGHFDQSDDVDDEEELARTAYHEAGHCVLAVMCGANASRASINPEQEGLFGQVEIYWPRRPSLVNELSVILGGPVAEMIYRSEPLHPGLVPEWSQDWKQAWAIARPQSKSDMICLRSLEQIVAQLYKTLSEDRFWSAIAAVQDLLMAHEEIEHEQIEYEVNVWLR